MKRILIAALVLTAPAALADDLSWRPDLIIAADRPPATTPAAQGPAIVNNDPQMRDGLQDHLPLRQDIPLYVPIKKLQPYDAMPQGSTGE